MGMQKVDYIKMVKELWGADITQEQWNEVEKEHPDISMRYNLQKQIYDKRQK